jgi:hypothetical protein
MRKIKSSFFISVYLEHEVLPGECNARQVLPVSIGCPRLPQPGKPLRRQLEVVLQDDGALLLRVAGGGAPRLQPGGAQAAIRREDAGGDGAATRGEAVVARQSHTVVIQPA